MGGDTTRVAIGPRRARQRSSPPALRAQLLVQGNSNCARVGADPGEMARLAGELRSAGLGAGLDVVRFAGTEPFDDARRDLEDRRSRGLHGGMAFTYRRPERSTDPSVSLPGAKALVVAARSYAASEAPAGVGGGGGSAGEPALGRIARSAVRDEYALLREGLGVIRQRLRANGYQARILVDDNALVDRAAAYRAGIGWWGKNTLIIIPGAGSWFVLGSVLTDAPLAPDDGPVADHCGRCSRCLPACPTGALVAPGVLDARRCLAWLLEAPGPIPTELREAVGNRIYGCDECQEVCPPNRAAGMRRARSGGGHGHGVEQVTGASVELVETVLGSDAELLARFGRFYLAGRDASLLRRNALVALGNIGDGNDPRVSEALIAALGSPNALVRGHAVWACGRLGRSELLEPLHRRERDPEVLAELAALPARR